MPDILSVFDMCLRAGTSCCSRSAYEHPRFYCVEMEEHHHVEGPHLPKAILLFAQGNVALTPHGAQGGV